MTTILKQIARKDAEDFMAQSYENFRELSGIHNDLKFGVFDSFIVDQVFQKSRVIGIEDAYGWMEWCNLVDTGRMFFGSICVGSTPSPDKCADENNEKLKALTGVFDGVFAGGNYGHDGHLILTGDTFTLRNNVVLRNGYSTYMNEMAGENLILNKGAFFPLEVGYYDPYRALETILMEGCLARWPYDHEYIYLFRFKKKSSISSTNPT